MLSSTCTAGWADYFLQAELAERLGAGGVHFYALDLRKFGRSLRDWQTPGYKRIWPSTTRTSKLPSQPSAPTWPCARAAPAPTVHIVAHSFGGLVAALWADRHPGRLGTLILNAPWLELQGSSLIRRIAMHLVEPLARTDPRRPFLLPGMPCYWESVSDQAHGEWTVDPVWRPSASFPIRAGWARAVLAGMRRWSAGCRSASRYS
ncbi:alpha/beta fold hydrolase [Pseudarthrobacter sp. S9]|uniref:alpha/beta fold hydrolase n=1 Tax=Pseudarthrobacter sp. S9 TaxID=3418421 RepID=UPI003D026E9B